MRSSKAALTSRFTSHPLPLFCFDYPRGQYGAPVHIGATPAMAKLFMP